MPSFILIHPTVWPQYANVTDIQRETETDRTDRQRSDSIGRTILQTVAQNGWTVKMPFRIGTRVSPRKRALGGGTHWRHLLNTLHYPCAAVMRPFLKLLRQLIDMTCPVCMFSAKVVPSVRNTYGTQWLKSVREVEFCIHPFPDSWTDFDVLSRRAKFNMNRFSRCNSAHAWKTRFGVNFYRCMFMPKHNQVLSLSVKLFEKTQRHKKAIAFFQNIFKEKTYT